MKNEVKTIAASSKGSGSADSTALFLR